MTVGEAATESGLLSSVGMMGPTGKKDMLCCLTIRTQEAAIIIMTPPNTTKSPCRWLISYSTPKGKQMENQQKCYRNHTFSTLEYCPGPFTWWHGRIAIFEWGGEQEQILGNVHSSNSWNTVNIWTSGRGKWLENRRLEVQGTDMWVATCEFAKYKDFHKHMNAHHKSFIMGEVLNDQV